MSSRILELLFKWITYRVNYYCNYYCPRNVLSTYLLLGRNSEVLSSLRDCIKHTKKTSGKICRRVAVQRMSTAAPFKVSVKRAVAEQQLGPGRRATISMHMQLSTQAERLHICTIVFQLCKTVHVIYEDRKEK